LFLLGVYGPAKPRRVVRYLCVFVLNRVDASNNLDERGETQWREDVALQALPLEPTTGPE
jgi:hypothetical protein